MKDQASVKEVVTEKVIVVKIATGGHHQEPMMTNISQFQKKKAMGIIKELMINQESVRDIEMIKVVE